MSDRPRGPLPNWQPTTERQIAICADVLARYRQHEKAGTLPRGPRGIFYDLRPGGMGNGATYRKDTKQHPVTKEVDGKRIRLFGEMEVHPAAVQEVVVLMRRRGMLRESWVADGRAVPPQVPDYDEDADQVARTAAYVVRNSTVDLDPQRFQPVFVEVQCEAADLTERLYRISEPLGVPVYPSSGQGGLKGKREMGERAAARDKPTVVLQVGDRDKHGDDIYTATGEDVVAWSQVAGAQPGEVVDAQVPGTPGVLRALRSRLVRTGKKPRLVFHRLALTIEQAGDLGLLDEDGKAEADAIPVPTFDAMLRDAIKALQLPARRKQFEAEQERERERLPEAIRAALDEDDDEEQGDD